ncbi:SH3 domain-containing protein [Fulvivirga ulvae]|uniref:SH3 domain-containing protein n=1 Tax=Fulvivirga ulvae TaxID=2904245 RepID=UPI001F24F947|nr:SH3 domain-containing protein [Fulvivirga ulvae]UII32124.1 SH3 domain-containing protein [Fulvivirga ulvae]
MKKHLTLILSFFLSQVCLGQYHPECTQLFKVMSRDGVIMRKEPSRDSEKLFALSYGQEVSVCGTSKKETINGIEGTWLSVMYQGKSGYAFGAWLKETEPFYLWSFGEIEMILLEGNIENSYGFQRRYIGLIPNHKEAGLTARYKLKEFDIRDYKNQQLLNRDKLNEEGLTFLMNRSTGNAEVIGRKVVNSELSLGQTISFKTDSANYVLYVLGTTVLNQENELDPISSIKDFRLILRRQKGGVISEQVIVKRDLTRWVPGDFLGGYFIDWIGDLDRDGELDILMKNIYHHECYNLQLFLSSKAEKNYLIKLVRNDEFCGG